MNNLKNVGFAVITLGVLITFGIMAYTTSAAGSLGDLLITLGFYVWVALPFVVLLALTFYIHRKGLSHASRAAVLITSVLVVVSSVAAYWASTLGSESSTSALVFIFIPIYALAATALLYGLSWLLLRSFMPKSRA